MRTVLPATLQQRPMRPDDAGLWAELLAAVEEVDRRGEHYDVEDCAQELTDPEIDLMTDSCLVFDGDRPVAYQLLRLSMGGAEDPRILPDAAVHPDHRRRGIGAALMAQARERADARGARLEVGVSESNVGAVALVESLGMAPVRWWSELVRDMDRPVTPAPLPAGLTAHPLGPDFDAARWDEPLRAAHNAAFADHWGSTPVDAASWVHWRTGSRNFRPACSVVACSADGAVAGYVMSYEFAADTARTGVRDLYVATVGTLVGWRGRGVAGALLARVLAAALQQGYQRSSLTVDSQNPTGALGVYERAGYILDRRRISYTQTP